MWAIHNALNFSRGLSPTLDLRGFAIESLSFFENSFQNALKL